MTTIRVGNIPWEHEPRILDDVTFAFDPTTHPETAETFRDRLARTIWLAIRPGHIVSDKFAKDCLNVADWVRGKSRPITAKQLHSALYERQMIGRDESRFTELLLPFVAGEREITYTVEM